MLDIDSGLPEKDENHTAEHARLRSPQFSLVQIRSVHLSSDYFHTFQQTAIEHKLIQCKHHSNASSSSSSSTHAQYQNTQQSTIAVIAEFGKTTHKKRKNSRQISNKYQKPTEKNSLQIIATVILNNASTKVGTSSRICVLERNPS